MAEAGLLEENRVMYNPWLIDSFKSYFDIVKTNDQKINPYAPYVHISSEDIWTLVARPGFESQVQAKRSIGGTSTGWVLKHVLYAQLGSDFGAKIKLPAYRDALRQEIVQSKFPEYRHAFELLFKLRNPSLNDQRTLRDAVTISETLQVPPSNRDAAFRSMVLSAYNYTCAATGWRAIIGDVQLLDAAHLIPLSESNDNRVKNGIVLTPTFHRAMDARLIAPGPDDRWHIAKFVGDSDLPAHEPIRDLNDKPVNYGGVSLRPDRESLEETVSRLGG